MKYAIWEYLIVFIDTITDYKSAISGQKFAIVIVNEHVLNFNEKDSASLDFSKYFPGIPIILMAQNSRGIPTYYGRKDIVAFLVNLSISQIPWKKYNFS